ncbi:MAG: hypothetical protein JRC87_11065 [Deltaproteobacteria bacterium]|nr:hypothetical protein [Deltaproteobacteria bacterium]
MSRELKVFTPGKQYSGEIHVPSPNLRTTDIFNSANFFWKDPAEKSFNDALLMFNVNVSIDGIREFQQFDRLQIRQPNIIFFHDNLKDFGDSKEKKRADVLKQKTREEKRIIHLVTKVRVNSFFDIKGSFYGLFKSKSVQKYIPLNDVVLHEVVRTQDKWVKKKIQIPNNFLGISTAYIETCSFDE